MSCSTLIVGLKFSGFQRRQRVGIHTPLFSLDEIVRTITNMVDVEQVERVMEIIRGAYLIAYPVERTVKPTGTILTSSTGK